MSPRIWPDRIRDMLSCGKNIQDFTADMEFNQFLMDPRSVRAVAFEFITIGEAARIIPQGFESVIRISNGGKCKVYGMYWCMNTSA